MSAGRTLARVRAPDEPGAQNRAWPVVRAAYREREAIARGKARPRIALALIPALLAGVLALTPAGATVRRAIREAFSPPHATAAPFALPAPGSVLVSGAAGAWTVSAGGSTHRLGAWRQAAWSPRGLYIVATNGSELAAIDPRGRLQWQLARPLIRDPAWAPPTGYRVAYLSGPQLRVVAGDGSGDHLLAADAARVGPAWKPGARQFQVAYVTTRGVLVLRDGDGGLPVWSRPVGHGVRRLAWSADGHELLVLSAGSAQVLAATGRRLAAVAFPAGAPASAGSLSPDGGRLAVVLGTTDVELVDLRGSEPSLSRAFWGPGIAGLTWSPNGEWLLASWPVADQWLLIRVGRHGVGRLETIARVAGHFSLPGARHRYPTVDGWCCTARGTAG
jgi:hypothetical protein